MSMLVCMMEHESESTKFLTPNALSARTDGAIGANCIRTAVKAGEIRAYRTGRSRFLIRLSDFDSWLETRRYQPVTDPVADRVAEQIRRQDSLE